MNSNVRKMVEEELDRVEASNIVTQATIAAIKVIQITGDQAGKIANSQAQLEITLKLNSQVAIELQKALGPVKKDAEKN